MKILYVADNRYRGNYGCRATSTALSQLIEKNNEIVGTITGNYTHTHNNKLFFIKGLGKQIYVKLGKVKHWDDIRAGIFLLFNFFKPHGTIFFSRFDFLTLDYEKSIRNLMACIPANPELFEFDLTQYDFDAMVVNGEGSFIFSTPPWRESIMILTLMYWAIKLDKKVYFTNAMFSDGTSSSQNKKVIKMVNNILEKCEFVSVREKESYTYAMKNMIGINPVIIPDALFTWYKYVNSDFKITDGKYFLDYRVAWNRAYKELSFSLPYICITGSSISGVVDKKIVNINRFVKLIQKLQKKCPNFNIFIVEACDGDEYMIDVAKKADVLVIGLNTPILASAKILANAAVYITGRYHPAIMASLGGTPCVFMGSNSHKTHSLQHLLEYDEIKEYPFDFTEDICDQIIKDAVDKIGKGIDLREKIKNRAYQLSLEAEGLADRIR